MTKDEWISHKIQVLEHENKGRSHQQNIAIAFSMYQQYNKKQQGGSIAHAFNKYMDNQIPKAQQGFDLNIAQQWANANPLPQGFQNNPTFFQTNQSAYPIPNNGMDQYLQGDNNGDGVVNAQDNVDKFGNPVNNTQQATNPYQTQPWNDYSFDGGISNPAAFQYGMYNFGQGKTTEGILGTAKSGLGFIREGLSAYSAGKANKYTNDQYQQKQYGDWQQFKYGQQGGTIVSNLTPSQVVQMNSSKSFAGLEVVPNFGTSGYFTTEEEFNRQAKARQSLENKTYDPNQGFVDITRQGNTYTDNGSGVISGQPNYRIWKYRPEGYVGGKTPVQGVDYTDYNSTQYAQFQKSPAYRNKYPNEFQNSGGTVAEMQQGGTYETMNPDTKSNPKKKTNFSGSYDPLFNYEALISPTQDASIYFAQQGGNMQQPQSQASPEAIIQAYAELSGQDAQAIIQQLQQLPPEQQQNALQQMMQAIQQAQSGQQALPEQQMQQGGELKKKDDELEITGAEALTGEYAMPVSDGQKVTVEAEEGEWIKDNKTGEVQQIVGKKHSEGGTDLNIEDAKIISDYTKIGAENAKHFSKIYDIKVSAKDTFATVLDRVNSKSGLKKLIDEEASLTEQMEKVLNKPNADESSQEINAQFLTDKMQELKSKQEPLKALRSSAFDAIFEKQEAVPKKGNGELLDEKGEPMKARQGGNINPLVLQLAEQSNIDPTKIQELLLNNKEYFQSGGYTDKDRQARFKDWAQNMKAFGYTGATDVSAKNLDEEAGKLQEWMAENKPELVVDYFKTQPMTAKGIDIIKEKYPDAFKQANIPTNKQSAQYTPEEKDALKNILGNQLDNNFWLDQFKDKKYDWRGVLSTTNSPIKPIGSDFNQIQAPGLPNYYQSEQQQPTVQQVVEQVKAKDPRVTGNVNLAFDPLYIPPSPTQPVFLAGVQAPQLDFIKATAEPNLVEAERQRLNTQEQLGFLPSSQRAAMLANSLAQGQSTTNQAISQVEFANQQAENATRNQQANLNFKADLTNQQFKQDYEAKVFAGQNAYEQALQNYYNQAYNIPGQIAELNRNKRMAYNQLNDKYKITNNGVQFVDDGQNIINASAQNPNANYVDANLLPASLQKQIQNSMKKYQK